MPDRGEEKVRDLQDVITVRTTPQIEAALEDQLRTLPRLALERGPREVAHSVFGLIACCIS